MQIKAFDHSDAQQTHSNLLLSIIVQGHSLYKPSGYFGVSSVCLWERVALGARQVPLLCSWAGLMRYQTQTSIHQPHWWGQWGATASVKRHIMAPCVGIGRPCLQRLLGTEGLKQYTTAASTLLCSARLSSLTLRAASQDFFLSLWFSGTKTEKKNVLLESGGLIFKCVHVCEWVKRRGHRGLID